MCFTKDTQSYFIVDNLQFKKILLHFRIIKECLRGDKFFPASVPHHMLWEHNVTNGM